ncbi:uroporphyrinogen-III synthase [Leucobacter sp. NPDC058333]|uniref:uroporphyrinogen-III synthase n=1 Tax=Leucobacter sp. NPDC058333 TaxID=3346450 RepID=UPI00365A134F
MTDSLAGVRVLVTRGGAAGDRDADDVRSRGGLPIVAPLTLIAPPEDAAPLAEAAAAWNRGEFDGVLITSANAAEAFADAGARPDSHTDTQRAPLIAAVGPATADALRARGFGPDLVPDTDFSAVGLSAAAIDHLGAAPLRLLLPVSSLADDTLETALTRAGHRVERVTAYRTIAAPRDAALETRVAAGDVDVILVLSGSGAREVARRFAPLPATIRLAAIGRPSARALAEQGLAADVIADPHTVANLLDRVGDARASAAPAHPHTEPVPPAHGGSPA